MKSSTFFIYAGMFGTKGNRGRPFKARSSKVS